MTLVLEDLARSVFTYRHEAIPNMSWKKNSIEAPIRPPNAPDSRLPAYRMEVRSASSRFVYHDDSRNKAPGKKGLRTSKVLV
jgi:hypothetical protein